MARDGGVPIIHFATGTAGMLEAMQEAGADVLGVDWRVDLGAARRRIGSATPIQGNLDPVALMAPWPEMRARADEVLAEAAGRAGHIFNLGHGILPGTPTDNVRRLVDYVHEAGLHGMTALREAAAGTRAAHAGRGLRGRGGPRAPAPVSSRSLDAGRGGGGESRSLRGGREFESAGVNVSVVHGVLPPEVAELAAGEVGPADRRFCATGVSIVIHPRNPMVPTMHANFRYFELRGPTEPALVVRRRRRPHARTTCSTRTCVTSTGSCKAACDRHDADLLPALQATVRRVLPLPSPRRARAASAASSSTTSMAALRSALFAFVSDVRGRAFVPAYFPIVERRRKDLPYTRRQRTWQRVRRGRYVEFNLVYDRGTHLRAEDRGAHRERSHVAADRCRLGRAGSPGRQPGVRAGRGAPRAAGVDMRRLRVATRGSALARAQSGMIADALRAAWPGVEVDLIVVRTGVRSPDDKSRFVKEIEDALLAGEADLAVHSAKDLPGQIPDGLAIVAVPERADPRDALCGADALDGLPQGAAVGTASLRRRAQLLAARPDLRVSELHGNVDTRLRRLREGHWDAIVLAAAGLARLGLGDGVPLAPELMVPAPGQGCLALEARIDDERVRVLAQALDHPDSHRQLLAERAVARRLDAGCQTRSAFMPGLRARAGCGSAPSSARPTAATRSERASPAGRTRPRRSGSRSPTSCSPRAQARCSPRSSRHELPRHASAPYAGEPRPSSPRPRDRPGPGAPRAPGLRRHDRDRAAAGADDAGRQSAPPRSGRRGGRRGAGTRDRASCCSASPPPRTPAGSGAYAPTGRPARGRGHQGRATRICSSMTDVCLCEYTDHGHCGVLATTARSRTTRRSSCSR